MEVLRRYGQEREIMEMGNRSVVFVTVFCSKGIGGGDSLAVLYTGIK